MFTPETFKNEPLDSPTDTFTVAFDQFDQLTVSDTGRGIHTGIGVTVTVALAAVTLVAFVQFTVTFAVRLHSGNIVVFVAFVEFEESSSSSSKEETKAEVVLVAFNIPVSSSS